MKRIAAAVFLATLLLATSLVAHTRLLRSEPGDGATAGDAVRTVRLWFSTPVEVMRGGVEVTGPDGSRVDAQNARADADEPSRVDVDVDASRSGSYRVQWRVVSADGHPVGGGFTFDVRLPDTPVDDGAAAFDPGAGAVGEPGPAWEMVEAADERIGAIGGAAGRWLHLLGLVLVTGPLVLTLLARPAAVTMHAAAAQATATALHSAPPATHPPAKHPPATRPLAAHPPAALAPAALWQGVAIGAAVLLAAAVMLLLHQMATLGAGPGAILPGRWGLLWQIRFGAALLLAWLALDGWLRRSGAGAAAGWRLPAALGATALLIVATSMSGHAATTPPVPLSVAVDALHVSAMAVWLGGLTAFVLLLLPALRRRPDAEQAATLGAIVPRFSAVALACVSILVVTGVYQTWRLVGAPEFLVSTAHGQALLVKLGLVALLMVPAAVNRFVVKPHLHRAAATPATTPGATPPAGTLPPPATPATPPGAARTFRRTVGAEAVLGAAVLAVTAVMTGLPPARGDAGDPGFAGFHFDPPLEPPAVSLAVGDDGHFDLAAQRGNAVLLFFGFTNCPDFCPRTLQEWRRVRELLGDDAARTRFVFVSVDPERDSPTVAAEYARRFDPGFVGLAPDSAELARIEAGFFLRSMRPLRAELAAHAHDAAAHAPDDNAAHDAAAHAPDHGAAHGADPAPAAASPAVAAAAPPVDDAPYEVIHSTRFFLLAPDGTVRVMYSHDAAAEDVAADIRRLLRR